MIRLFRYEPDKNDNSSEVKSIYIDSDEFPDNVFSAQKCEFDLKSSTVKINGVSYLIPIEDLNNEFSNKAGYYTQNVFYPFKCDNNPSGNLENLWLRFFLKRGTSKQPKVIACFLYTYDANDNIEKEVRVNTYYSWSAYQNKNNKENKYVKLYTQAIN